MATKLPYLTTPGTVTNVLNKIKEAKQPDRFTIDFLNTKLGFRGGNAVAMIPMLKKMGFLNTDGSPTNLYSSFRNDNTSGAAVADGIKRAYHELYDRNEYAHDLKKDQFTNLVVEITGLEKNDSVVSKVVSTFEKLKALANFDAEDETADDEQDGSEKTEKSDHLSTNLKLPLNEAANTPRVGMNLSYTINLNLPETTNIDVFNAIFKSLKEHMLK